MSIVYPVMPSEIVITAGSNDGIRITDSTGTVDITLAAGTYWLLDGSDASCIVKEILDQLNATTDTYTASVTYDKDPDSASCVVNFTSSSSSFVLQWAASQTTFDSKLIGWTSSTSPAASQDSAHSPWSAWVSNEPFRQRDPMVVGATSQTRARSLVTTSVALGDIAGDWACSLEWIDPKRTLEASNTADRYATWQRWLRLIQDGRQIRLYEWDGAGDLLSAEQIGDRYVMDAASLSEFAPRRHSPGFETWSWDFALLDQGET